MVATPRKGMPVRLRTGDAVFTSRERPCAFRTDERLTLVVSALPESSLPARVRRLVDLPPGALPHVPLVDAVVELLIGIASRSDEPFGFDAGYAERGLIDLESAILLEVMGDGPSLGAADRLSEAAIEYIDRHIAEPDLAPPGIAAALGVSVRSLHAAFAGKQVTVAKRLRDRRLDLVAEEVLASTRRPSSASLAARFGHPGPDHLTRAFRHRFGRSIVEYRSSAQ